MKFLLLAHAAIALCAATLIAVFFDFPSAWSFFLGAMLMQAYLVVLGVALPYIFAKKQFALSIGVIVFKFAILAWIMNEAVKAASPATPNSQFYLGWFAGGIALINVSALVTAFRYSRS